MADTLPMSIQDLSHDRTNRLWWLLFIMSKCGGEADASESKWNWLNAFCSDFEDDTFNLAIDLGLLRCTHNTDTDHSTAWLTDGGKALVAYFDKPPSLPLVEPDAGNADDIATRPRYSMRRMRDEIAKAEERGRTAERARAIAVIEHRLPLYTQIGQINALRECISSIRG